MWTMENTEGFSQDELDVLNEAQLALEARHGDVDPKNIADYLNNKFNPGVTVAELVAGFGK